MMTDIIKDDIPFLEYCFESVAHNYIKKLGSAYVKYLVPNAINNYCDTPASKVYTDTRVIRNGTLTRFTQYSYWTTVQLAVNSPAALKCHFTEQMVKR